MDFLDFIKASPTSYHAVGEIKKLLDNNGFEEISEKKRFELKLGGKYYITRNLSSIIAFVIPSKLDNYGFNITAAHVDSPTFKLKPNFDLDLDRYSMLNTEVYGGPILNTFFDRPLNIAGRVMVKNGNKLEAKLVSFDKYVCSIPNLCIHFNRDVNNGVKLNPQVECLPLLGDKNNNGDLLDSISKKLKINKEDIVSHDLFLSLVDRGMIGGLNDEFIMAPQIDNLECSYALTMGLLNGKVKDNTINVMALFDAEEIGSRTRSGADSRMLEDLLLRISMGLYKTNDEHLVALNNSFMVSADNAHAYHPSYASKYDPLNKVYMNEGIVIKSAARGSYTTDGYTEGVFKLICDRVNSKYQMMTNRSDILGGGTLGAISLSHISIPSVDIGLAQLAMHSAMETCGRYDIDILIKAISEFYSVHLDFIDDKNIEIR